MRKVEESVGGIIETEDEYQKWLKTKEREFRGRIVPGDLLYPNRKYYVETGLLDKKGDPETDWIIAENVKGYIDEETADCETSDNEFYPTFFSEPRNKFKYTTPETMLFRHFHNVREKYKSELQKVLSYVIETGDELLAKAVLPLINATSEESEAGAAYWYAYDYRDDKTGELKSDFFRALRLYGITIDPMQDPQENQKPRVVKVGGKTKSLNTNFPAYPIDTEKLKKLFEYLRDNEYISKETRIEDWMQANGHEQQGEEFKKIKWKRSIEQLTWMIALMYPQDNKEDFPRVQAGMWKWVVEYWHHEKDGVIKELKEQRLREAKNKYNKAKNPYGEFFKTIKDFLRGTQKQDE